jgi:hypothetical protein
MLWEARVFLLRHHPQCLQATRLAGALERAVDQLMATQFTAQRVASERSE